jgi:Mu-like prophage protein gp46
MEGDIAIVWNNNHGSLALTADGDLLTDAGLETAILISLFTDRRAGEHDELPATETDRRGWWGNDLEDTAEEIGSKLWLLRREKQLPEVIVRAEEYARAALAWLVKDKVAGRVVVRGSFPTRGWLLLDIDVYRPDGTLFSRKYDYNWQAQKMRNHDNAIQ